MKKYPGIRDFKNQHLPNIIGEVSYRNSREPKVLFYNKDDVVVDRVELSQTTQVADLIDVLAQRGFKLKGASAEN